MQHNISILGSTGSIGTQTLDVLEEHSSKFSPRGLSAGSNIDLLSKQIETHHPEVVSVKTSEDAKILADKFPRKLEILWGAQGNIDVATLPKTDKVVIATPGLPGIKPTLEAIKKKKTIALATKEVLVAAGGIITKAARTNGISLLPIDSEHSAIFQCLEGRSIAEVKRIFLTCSGGPFRGYKTPQLKKVSVKQALKHPSWKMGNKITIDSATLMNKGFEVLEAAWLFGLPLDKIKVIVHPQSVIHSAVEFIDGSIMAQIGPADMRLPIQYALFYPEKRLSNTFKRFSFDHYPNLSFEHPDKKTFRCLELAYDVGKVGGTAPVVLNAANDVAVEAVLNESLSFYKIPEVIEKVLSTHKIKSTPNLEGVIEADSWARKMALKLVSQAH